MVQPIEELNKYRGLWEEVKENLRKQRSCKRHQFEPQNVRLGQKITCLQCGGQMGLVNVSDYIAGFKAAGGNVNDVWPGYEEGVNALGE